MTFKEHRASIGGEAEASFLKISGSGSYDQSSYDKFRSESCSEKSHDQAFSSSAYFFQKTPDHKAIDEWKNCMLNKSGFNCWAEPSVSDSTILMVVNYTNLKGKLPIVVDSGLSQGNAIRNGKLYLKGGFCFLLIMC